MKRELLKKLVLSYVRLIVLNLQFPLRLYIKKQLKSVIFFAKLLDCYKNLQGFANY